MLILKIVSLIISRKVLGRFSSVGLLNYWICLACMFVVIFAKQSFFLWPNFFTKITLYFIFRRFTFYLDECCKILAVSMNAFNATCRPSVATWIDLSDFHIAYLVFNSCPGSFLTILSRVGPCFRQSNIPISLKLFLILIYAECNSINFWQSCLAAILNLTSRSSLISFLETLFGGPYLASRIFHTSAIVSAFFTFGSISSGTLLCVIFVWTESG